MSFSRPIQWYYSHADPIWPDNTFNTHSLLLLHRLLFLSTKPGLIYNLLLCGTSLPSYPPVNA